MATLNNVLVVKLEMTSPTAFNYTTTRQMRVFDARARVTTAAAAATSCTIGNAGTAITNDFSLGNNNAGRVGRAGTIDDASYLVSAGGTIRATLTGAGTAAIAYVHCYPV